MPILPFETYYLNFYDRRALIQESHDHLACQLDSIDALTKGDDGDVPQIIMASDIVDPMRTGNHSALSTIVKVEGQVMETIKRPEPVKVVNHLQRFTCFNNLVPEIRAQIWKQALPELQVVELYRTRFEMINYQMSLTARKALGGLLLACSESNAIVKACYMSVCFGVIHPEAPLMLMDPRSDILYMPSADQVLLQVRNPGLSPRLCLFSSLAMPSSILKFFLLPVICEEFKYWLSALHGLKTLLLVTKETYEQRGKRLEFVPYTGPDCPYKINLTQAWKDVTEELGMNIELVWVNPYRDGALAHGVVHSH